MLNPFGRRRVELGLISMAATITAGAYVLAALGKKAVVPPVIVVFLIVLLGLLLVAHVATRIFVRGADSTLLPLAALLNGIGYVMIARLSDRLAGLQTIWTFVAVAGYVGTLVVVERVPDLARYKWTFVILGTGLLLAPRLPLVGRTVGGENIGVRLGPITFQPGEFAKILLTLFFAGYLYERRELISAGIWRIGRLGLSQPRYFLPIALAWGVTDLVLLVQGDLGTSLLFFMLFVVMLWVATERIAFLTVGVVLFAGAAYACYRLVDRVHERVSVWIDPWSRYQTNGYQVVQGIFAIGDGGLAGTGLGRGQPNLIPALHDDFIFAAIAEELGLLGAAAVLMSYMLIVGAGLRIAVRAERAFEKLLATGLSTLVGVQAFIIIGGVSRVIPLTGIALPFISYGGSSLVANYVLLALLIRVSDSTARHLGELPDDPTMSEHLQAWTLRRKVLSKSE